MTGPDRRKKGRMIMRYEILRHLVIDSPQTASQLWGGVPISKINVHERLYKLESAGYVKRVGKAKKNVDYFPNLEIGGWGILWAVTKKGRKFWHDYIRPNYKRGFLIRA